MPEKLKDPHFVTAYTLIVMTFIMDMAIVFMVLAWHHSPDDVVKMILSVWHLALAVAYGYELGSSAGSKQKDEQIAALSKNGKGA